MHLGHVIWIYEAIIGKLDKNYQFYSKEFLAYLNSYYQQFGIPQDKGLRGIVSRPTFEQICTLPEYYPTRTEIEIIRNLQGDL